MLTRNSQTFVWITALVITILLGAAQVAVTHQFRFCTLRRLRALQRS